MPPRQLSDGGPDGEVLGQSPTDLIAFYGATPIARPSGAAQTSITDSSGGTANPATGIGAIGGTYVQATLANAFATLIAETNALRAALVAVGLIKGSA